jgi:anti-anti-sigma factor
MRIRTIRDKEWEVLYIERDVSHAISAEFSEFLLERINGGAVFLRLDMSGCEFISSSGLGAIAAALMVARARGGNIELLNVSRNVVSLFRSTKLDSIISINKKS